MHAIAVQDPDAAALLTWRSLAREIQSEGLDPEAAAQHVLDAVGLGQADQEIIVQDVIGKLGVEYRPWQMAKAYGLSGKLQLAAGTPVLLVRSSDPRTRRRFTLAHELGHLMLHVSPEEKGDRELFREDDRPKDAQEREADQFAAALLMPRWRILAFVSHYPTFVPSPGEMRDAFGVSDAAFRQRIKSLGIERLVFG